MPGANNAGSAFGPRFIPPEILDQIASRLGITEIINTRTCSFEFSQFFTPYLNPFLTLHVSTNVTMAVSASKLRPFIPAPQSFTHLIKNLRIELRYNTLRENVASGHSGKMFDIVREELSRFEPLESLEVVWDYPAPTVWDPLSSLTLWERDLLCAVPDAAGLRHLKLGTFEFLQLSLDRSLLPQFTRLNSLDLEGVFEFTGIAETTSQHIKSSLLYVPTLTSLRIKTARHSDTLFLEDLVPSRSTLPHLPLHTLELDGDVEWSRSNTTDHIPYFSNLRKMVILSSVYNTGGEWDGFWHFLRLTNVHLTHIHVDHEITPSLIQYMTTFQEIHVLKLTCNDPPQWKPAIFEPLINQALPLHAPTLQELVVPVPYIRAILDSGIDERFPRDIAFWPPPLDFPKLEHLLTQMPPALPLTLPTVQAVLEWLEQFPVLEHAEMDIRGCFLTSFPTSASGMSNMLVGRTGRPRRWTVHDSLAQPRWSCDWQIQHSSEGRWVFVKDSEEDTLHRTDLVDGDGDV